MTFAEFTKFGESWLSPKHLWLPTEDIPRKAVKNENFMSVQIDLSGFINSV